MRGCGLFSAFALFILLCYFSVGDILNVKVERSWEFEPTSPIRSIVPPYIMCAPAMYIMKWVFRINFLMNIFVSV